MSSSLREVVSVMWIRMAVVFLFLSAPLPMLFAQVSPGSKAPGVEALKYTLAKSFEESGDYENAVKAFEELHRLHPENLVYFEGLQRAYLQVKRYDHAAGLIRDRLAASPNDVNLMGMLGSVLYRAGKEKEAFEEWNRAIAVSPRNQSTYRIISGYLIENRLFERSTELYLRARRESGDASLFADDLGYLYSALLRFGDATSEYVGLLLRDPNQLGFVESRIASYTNRPEALAAALQVAHEMARDHASDLSLQYLLGWLYMEGKQYDEAFEVSRVIDRLTNREGAEVFSFAERTLHEKAYEPARRAYRLVIDDHPKSNLRPQALFGYARAVEELAAAADSGAGRAPARGVRESNANASEAVGYYEQVVSEFPNTEFAAQSLYRTAFIFFHRSFDLNRAREALTELETRMPWSRIVPRAKLLKADVLIAQGDLEGARGTYDGVLTSNVAAPTERDEAAFGVALLLYSTGKFEDAKKQLKSLTENTAGDFSNDALKLSTFIDENAGMNPEPLQLYATAQLLERQHRYSEAQAVLDDLEKRFGSSTVADEGAIMVACLLARMGDFPAAVAAYDSFLVKFTDSIDRDDATFERSRIIDLRFRDPARAIKAYESFLVDYPNSLYVADVRKRIRELRGDSL